MIAPTSELQSWTKIRRQVRPKLSGPGRLTLFMSIDQAQIDQYGQVSRYVPVLRRWRWQRPWRILRATRTCISRGLSSEPRSGSGWWTSRRLYGSVEAGDWAYLPPACTRSSRRPSGSSRSRRSSERKFAKYDRTRESDTCGGGFDWRQTVLTSVPGFINRRAASDAMWAAQTTSAFLPVTFLSLLAPTTNVCATTAMNPSMWAPRSLRKVRFSWKLDIFHHGTNQKH